MIRSSLSENLGVIHACKHRTRSISAFQMPPPEQLAQLDDAAVRDCMISKGYKIATDRSASKVEVVKFFFEYV